MPYFSRTQVQCAACQKPFTAQVEQIIDVGLDPDAKQRLFSGELNIITCPHCGNAGRMDAPLLYHDPEHELLMVYIPLGLNLAQNQREQLIGSLTRNLMDNIPSEARRGYLFNPNTVLSIDGLVEKILEADGVPLEMIKAQKKQSQLLNRLIAANDSELDALIKAHDNEINQDLFQMLESLIRSTRDAGQESEAARLTTVRNRLLALASWSREKGITAEALDRQALRLDLINQFLQSSEEKWPDLIQQYDKQLDYQFFQLLTAAAEGAPQELADKILALRDSLLTLTTTGKGMAKGQAEVEELVGKAKKAGGLTRELLLEQILQAEPESIEAIAVAAAPLLDYSFFLLMADRIDEAKKKSDPQFERLESLRSQLVQFTEKWEQARNSRIQEARLKIDALLENGDREKAISDLLPEIDELFFSILSSSIEEAKKAGQSEKAKALELLLQQIVKAVEETAPPEFQTINRLMLLENESDVRNAIIEGKEKITPELLEVMKRMQEEFKTAGQGELARRLSAIYQISRELA